MKCVRCDLKITAGQPCDFHYADCAGGDLCRCPTDLPIHRRCCLQCTPVKPDHRRRSA